MPDCHGARRLLSGSQAWFRRLSDSLATNWGVFAVSIVSAQPRPMIFAAIQSVSDHEVPAGVLPGLEGRPDAFRRSPCSR